ncbi:16S rRNA (cytosine(967)-C(5))-methyltransferase [Rhodothermaceae bacterium RA]|nr:16S rRNA (cytosine(967)-C(5))-methyltransferase [Rhodothermaceae bacterium RA]
MPTPVRLVALRQLNRIEQQGAYVGLVGDDAGLDARQERQATEYVAGVTRWRRWLDFLINRFYHGASERLDPALRQVLRIGLYDLLFLQTPPHAAIHEAVELAKGHVHPKVAGLVNGLLRAVQRHRGPLPEPDTGDAARDLAIRFSHPTWMVRRWLARFGPEATAALLAWNNARPSYGLRVNTLRTTPEAFRQRLGEQGIEGTPSPYLDDFVRVPKLQPVMQTGLLADGLCAVQDESAGLIVRLLDPHPGEVILDGCAAPGGKALYAALRMQDQGQVWAFDRHPNRIGLVAQAAAAHGLSCLRTEAADLRTLPERADLPPADRVLLDAPCSGLGVLARRADLRWQRTAEELTQLTRLQAELLDAAARLVRPGGVLVYGTCTIEPEENEAQVAAFLQRHPGFRLEPAAAFVPAALCTPEGYFASLPHRHGIDGAFGARLRRDA